MNLNPNFGFAFEPFKACGKDVAGFAQLNADPADGKRERDDARSASYPFIAGKTASRSGVDCGAQRVSRPKRLSWQFRIQYQLSAEGAIARHGRAKRPVGLEWFAPVALGGACNGFHRYQLRPCRHHQNQAAIERSLTCHGSSSAFILKT